MRLKTLRVLLVNPLFGHDPDGVPPLGLASVASAARMKGHKVKILDLNLQPRDGASVESSVYRSLKYDVEVVGLTCWGNVTPFVIEFCKRFKTLRPETKLVIGGEYASFRSESILKEAKADFVVRGEGERTFVHLLDELEGEGNTDRVYSVSCRKADGVVSLPDTGLIDMDNLPFVNWGIFDNLKKYRGYKEHGRLPFQASRGCPFRCIFCSVQKTWGGVQRRKSPRRVIDEIKYLVEEFDVRQLQFYDDTFTLDTEWVSKFCNLMLKESLDISWRVMTRIDLVEKGLLSLMKRAGCVGIFFGVESVSPRVQKFIGKHYTENLVRKRIADTIATGIDVQASMIFGWPVDTLETVKHDSRFCQKMLRMGVSGIHLHLLFPLPGTKLTDECSSLIIPNPYPKMTQPALAKLPAEYYSLMERHKKYVPDFWMFRSQYVDPLELIRVYADIKLWMFEENIRRLSISSQFGSI